MIAVFLLLPSPVSGWCNVYHMSVVATTTTKMLYFAFLSPLSLGRLLHLFHYFWPPYTTAHILMDCCTFVCDFVSSVACGLYCSVWRCPLAVMIVTASVVAESPPPLPSTGSCSGGIPDGSSSSGFGGGARGLYDGGWRRGWQEKSWNHTQN